MADPGAKIRLFVAGDLGEGAAVALGAAQAHYLFAVMRLGVGAGVAVFNGRDGAWWAEVTQAGRRDGRLAVRGRVAPQGVPADLWLLFAPVKKARTDFIVEKAAELGVARILPVFTQRTNAERLRVDRLRAHAVEAAEQCEATWVAEVAAPVPLAGLLGAWDPGRRLVFCDERRDAPLLAAAMAGMPRGGPWAVLVGPEGGFDAAEAAGLRGMAGVVPVSLGPRVLRADTAAVAALALVQAAVGDWG